MRKYFLFYIFLTSCSSNFDLQNGDFLFQDLDSSELCTAIEAVTDGYMQSDLSHVGLVVNIDEETLVIEAIPPKVILTPLDTFLSRSRDDYGNPKVIVGRLKPKYQYLIDKSINYCLSKVGYDYDEEFIFENNSFYCAELIYNSFNDDEIFKAKPMIFENPYDENILKIWKDYYSKLNKPIPKNKLGINPGIMSKSNAIEIVYIYGHPNGIKIEKDGN